MTLDDVTSRGARDPARRAVRALVAARLSWVVAIALSATAVVAAFTVPRDADDDARIRQLTATGCVYDTRHDPGRTHVAHPTYTVDPPAGGDHEPQPADAGVYTSAVPSDGRLVHALEHGLIVVWLSDALPPTDRRRAEQYATEFRPDVVVVTRASLQRGVALTAWHRRLLCPTLDDAVVRTFVCTFRARGPERISLPGGGCGKRDLQEGLAKRSRQRARAEVTGE